MRRLFRSLTFLALTVTSLGADTHARAEEASIADLERDFRELPLEARRLTGPLFWLHGDEPPELLESYVAKVAEGGNGCFTAESRPHNDWLGRGWYRDLDICLQAAKRHGLKMWIFDERWWPSGEVARQVPQRYGSKQLNATEVTVQGPSRYEAEGFDRERLVAALAGRLTDDGIEGASLVDLADHIRDSRLVWDVPPGQWQVMHFTWEVREVYGRYLVDGASAEAVDWYIRTVYQPHYERFKEDFGTNIPGFFYDEPETRGDWGTEVRPMLEERGVDWKRAFVAWKFKLAGEEQIAAKHQYQDALAEAWGRTLYGGISRWCDEHGVQSIGHFLEHRNEYLHPELCAGNMFPLQKYSHMGGIDAVFRQFAWGRRDANDNPCWQTPKLGSSITHAYGKADDVTMVEIYGARGQDITYPEMKWWLDHMQVSGVNFIIPHSFNPRAPFDLDCPPYFYNGGYEPRWPLYRVLADYSSRLTHMLTGGRHVCPVALLYLGGSAHVGEHVLPDKISEALQDALYDCDWLPYEVFEQDMKIAGKELKLRDESYRVLIVPGVEVIPYETLAKAREFFDAGGVVVGYGLLPTKSATLGKGSTVIASLREAIWGDPQPGLEVCKMNRAGGRSYLLPGEPTPEQLQEVLAGDAGVHPTLEVIEGDTGHWLHVLHRVKAGRDVFFITNQNHLGEARRFVFRIEAAGVPECWDPMSGLASTVPFDRSRKHVDVTLTMQPNESTLLVFREQARPLPVRFDPGGRSPRQTISLVRDQSPPPGPAALEADNAITNALQECSWIWYPEGNPAQAAPAGTRYFRKAVTLPSGRKVTKAIFTGTADNSFVMFANGEEVAQSVAGYEGWRNVVQQDISAALKPGVNQLAFSATNESDRPNPAGAIGVITIEFDRGQPLAVRLNETWKAGDSEQPGWESASFDDSSWPAAKLVAAYGAAPWGMVGRKPLTLSPVEADPFLGHCDVPRGTDLSGVTIYLEMDELQPEAAARVTINGEDAGGFISAPLRVDVTRMLKPGRNTILIEPFAPLSARLAIYER
ncbi:MAG: hypothetical protein JSV91_15880 [Phycisphaerales bacterium]|nr:MAG: hypothetical protein JSV91_15880 [Phycisphaerales bacterium]